MAQISRAKNPVVIITPRLLADDIFAVIVQDPSKPPNNNFGG